MGSRWALAFPLFCLVGLLFIGITTGWSSDGGANHVTPALAHNIQLPRRWRTLQDLNANNSRERRNTPELSTGSWTIFSGNNTATVTSTSGFQNQITNNIKKN
ncbi:uncharacterized protein LOC134668369 [Cydia fagiglandana]|uniref:uncharacterized protein LOC134668369 n=1 Tax=Cydia fagiglandana TaxID=1458189 RepID=UPI002FEDED5B